MFCFSLSPLRRGKVCPERAEGVRGLVIYSINQVNLINLIKFPEGD